MPDAYLNIQVHPANYQTRPARDHPFHPPRTDSMARTKRIPSLMLTLTLLPFVLVPEARAGGPTAEYERYMDAAVKVDGFSGAVLVSRKGETLFARGYGLANVEHDVPNTPRTRFRLGSITKQFTAMAILVLKEQGKLALDDPIGKYVDDAPAAWKKVTLHHLLTHTSGVPSYTSDPSYVKKMARPESVKSMIARFRDKPLDFESGSKFSYSNSGYFLLGAVIEKASGTSYEAFLKSSIFDPLGLKDTGYDHFETVIPGRASGYEREGDQLRNAPYLDMSQPYAAGSLYSTVEDLARWDRALHEGKLISKASYDRMFKTEKAGYAYGWAVADRSGRKEVGHGGGINGFATRIDRYPEQDVCVVVLCNVVPVNPGRVAHGLTAITFGEPVKLPEARRVAKVTPEVLEALTGRYSIAPDKTLTVRREGGRLLAQVTDQPSFELLPESDAEFHVKGVDATVKFVKGQDGRTSEAVIHQGGREVHARRTGGPEAGPGH